MLSVDCSVTHASLGVYTTINNGYDKIIASDSNRINAACCFHNSADSDNKMQPLRVLHCVKQCYRPTFQFLKITVKCNAEKSQSKKKQYFARCWETNEHRQQIIFWFPQLYIDFCMLLLWVWRLFFLCFYFILFLIFIFLERLLVLYFSLVAPAICYLFSLHVVLYVFLANKWWWWW